jgi:methyl-branched lipid omega-hydroxylase
VAKVSSAFGRKVTAGQDRAMPEYRTADDIQLGDLEFWARPLDERHAAFERLRALDGMAYHEERSVLEGGIKGPGFWSAVRYDDVRYVNRHPKLFSSAGGITLGEQVPETLEFFGSMIVMDDPRHAKLRLLVQKGFTPKNVAAVEDSVRARAKRLVEEAKDLRECDFVAQFAAPLPLQVICDMLGVPPADEQQIFDWTNMILGVGDPDFVTDLNGLIGAAMGMFQYAQALGEDRLRTPTDDITSALMHAEVDGQRLTPAEFGSFFILLAVAGNETTRNAISWGMHQLTEDPDQRRQLQANYGDLALKAADEIVRWSSPVIHMRRVATEDVDVNGQLVRQGEKVVMWYWSANRDESHFADGATFDIHRPNTSEMVGYGAGGPHFCLGANLARREIQFMFDEIFRELPDLEITGEPARLKSAFINGIKRMPCAFTPR